MKNLHWFLLLIVFLFVSKNGFSQQVKIKVTDSFNDAAVSGVKIDPICKDGTIYTDHKGEARLQLNTDRCCVVKITKLGYVAESVEICSGDEILELLFFRTFNIKGTIKNEQGIALNRTRIALGSDCGDGQRVTYTDALGRFKLSPPAIGTCCYQLDISHIDYQPNTAVFCTTDEIHSKDISLEHRVSNTEQFKTANISYSPKILTAPPADKVVASTAAYKYTPISTSTPTYTTSPTSVYSSTPTTNTSTYIASSLPVYSPTVSTYTPPPSTSYPATTYTSAPAVVSSPEPAMITTYKNKYLDPIDLSVSDLTPSSAGFSYFSFSQSVIRPDAYYHLNNVATFMQNNADLVVEIAVHCDSRGDRLYNQQLSELRARALADYLTGKGIGSNRLIVRGYGESQPLNHCMDNVPCSDAEHRLNRRSLFRIQGSIYDADYAVSQSYQAYRPPTPVAAPVTGATPTTNTQPKPGVPCPDCPVPELDSEEYMDVLHREEYYDDDFYDSNDGGN